MEIWWNSQRIRTSDYKLGVGVRIPPSLHATTTTTTTTVPIGKYLSLWGRKIMNGISHYRTWVWYKK